MILNNELKVNVFDYNYKINYSTDFYKLGNGKYKAADRGEAYDHYICDIKTHGKDNNVEAIYSYLNATPSLVLTDIKGPIFGANVDYTEPVSVVVSGIDLIENTDMNAFDLNFNINLVSCTFVSMANTLPTLKALKSGFKKGKEFTDIVITAYNRSNVDYQTLKKASGKFEGVFTCTYDELAQIQNYKQNVRSETFDMPNISGVEYPFGQLNGNTNLKCKLYEISSVTQISPVLYTIKIIFVQD